MSDQWAWWREALAGRIGPMQETKLESGFYRHFRGDPVAIWRDAAGGLSVLRDGAPLLTDDARQATWLECAKKPITRDAYNARRNSGRWDGQQEPKAEAPAHAAPARSNVSADPYQALINEIEDKLASAAAWVNAHPRAETAAESDYARNLQAELLALNKRADAMHTVEKAPSLKAGRAVDERFRFRETVADQAKTLRLVFEQFMVAEDARLRAVAQQKFEAERRAAIIEGQRVAAECAKLFDDDPIAALTSPEPALPVMPTAPDVVKVKAGGAVGRAAGLRSEWVGEVEDHAKALAHFANNPDIMILVAKLADKAAKSTKGAVVIPGVKIVERRRAA